MTPEEFARRMKTLDDDSDKNWDEERSHIKADALMCEVLRHLGYSEGVAVFELMRRYYS